MFEALKYSVRVKQLNASCFKHFAYKRSIYKAGGLGCIEELKEISFRDRCEALALIYEGCKFSVV